MITEELLHQLSWQVERHFRRHGHLRGMLWLTSDAAGNRQLFETAFRGPGPDMAGRVQFSALRAEIRSDFEHDGVVAYSVAVPSAAHIVLSPTILHVAHERKKLDVIALESHDAITSLRTHREILRPVGLTPRLGSLDLIEVNKASEFGALLCPSPAMGSGG